MQRIAIRIVLTLLCVSLAVPCARAEEELGWLPRRVRVLMPAIGSAKLDAEDRLARTHTLSNDLQHTLAEFGAALVSAPEHGGLEAALRDAARGEAVGARARSAPRLETTESVALVEALDRVLQWREIELTREQDPLALGALLRARGLIEAFEPVYLHYVSDLGSGSGVDSAAVQTTEITTVPRSLADIIEMEAAHAIIRGADGDVLIAIVDGGTDWRHPDLQANVWTRPGEIAANGVDDDGNGFIDDVHGWNYPRFDGDPTGLPETPRSGEHGTHIAGIISADTGNGVGANGVSGDAAILLVNSAHPTIDSAISFGYSGILYAASSGAAIINCSWGRKGRYSQYEADVIQAVTAMGSLVIAAAGNGIRDIPFYPGYYEDVLSVTAIRSTLERFFGSNSAGWIDLAAPGVDIYSTLPGDRYGSRRGSSQAAAVVSGVAALVATAKPDWSPRQIAEQLRWTALSLEGFHPEEFRQKLGTGVVQAVDALQMVVPGIRLDDFEIVDEDGDGNIEPNEVLTLGFTLHNVLADADAFRVTLFAEDPALTPLETVIVGGPLRGGRVLDVPRGMRVWVGTQAPVAELVEIRLQIAAEGRTVHAAIYPELQPLHASLGGARIRTSLTANGKLGFSDVTRPGDPGGEGLRRPDEPSRMLGGALLIGDGPARVSDGVPAAAPTVVFEDFVPGTEDPITVQADGLSDERVVMRFSDRGAPHPLLVNIRNTGRAYADEQRGGFVLSEYVITASSQAVVGGRVGLMIDWEVNQRLAESDRAGFDLSRRLAYSLDASAEGVGGGGVAVLEGPGSFAGAWFPEVDETGTGPALYDLESPRTKISDAELWDLMTRVPDPTPSPPSELAQVFSMGPFDLAPGESTRLVVAWVLGADLDELRQEVEQARRAFEALEVGLAGRLPEQPVLLANAPNPFRAGGLSGGTVLRFTLPEAASVRLRIFDLRGRLVSTLLDAPREAGAHVCPWPGTNGRGVRVSSGVYYVLLETPLGQARQAVTLLK